MPEPIRFTKIDESNRDIHPRLTEEDSCSFLFEYTSGKQWDFSATNGLISTLKRKPGAKGQYYKNKEISRCAGLFRGALSGEWLGLGTLVPVPPSKAVGDPAYDDRIERICRSIAPRVDVRPLVRQIVSTPAAHEKGGRRPTVDELVQIYQVDEALCVPFPRSIAIVDDVLTAGTHFKAVQQVLLGRFPAVPIYGLFVARRIFPDAADDFDPLDF